MRVHSSFFPVALLRQFILIHLYAVLLSGGLVFAQDPKHAIDSEVDAEYFVLIVTQGTSLNVRQTPSSSSPVVASLPKNAKVPFLSSTNNAASGKGTWFQIEYSKGKLGWVSSGYSKKIKAPKNEPTPKRVAKLESTSQATVKEVKPVAKANKNNFQNSLRSDDIVKNPAVENKKVSQKAKVKEEKTWANIDGFRSAKFGMGREEVTRAIFQDFGIASRNITVIKHPTEGTQSLGITVKDLLPNSGSSRIVYVLGFQSKRLTLVNMITGHPADSTVAPQQVVNIGKYMGNYLLRKRYKDDGLVAHAKLGDGSILIFRGKDQKGRMVVLRLSDLQPSNKDNENLKMSLNLSYIEKPEQPDVFKIKEGDF